MLVERRTCMPARSLLVHHLHIRLRCSQRCGDSCPQVHRTLAAAAVQARSMELSHRFRAHSVRVQDTADRGHRSWSRRLNSQRGTVVIAHVCLGSPIAPSSEIQWGVPGAAHQCSLHTVVSSWMNSIYHASPPNSSIAAMLLQSVGYTLASERYRARFSSFC